MAATKALPERQGLVPLAIVQSINLLHGHAAPCNIHRVAVAILIILAVQTSSVFFPQSGWGLLGPQRTGSVKAEGLPGGSDDGR